MWGEGASRVIATQTPGRGTTRLLSPKRQVNLFRARRVLWAHLALFSLDGTLLTPKGPFGFEMPLFGLPIDSPRLSKFPFRFRIGPFLASMESHTFPNDPFSASKELFFTSRGP